MIDIVKKFNKLLDKRQKYRMIVLFFITLIGAFLEVLGVTLMIPLITAIMQPDIITTNAMAAKVCAVFDIHTHKTFVVVCIAALIVVFIVKDVFLIFEYYVQARFVYNNKFQTQKQLLHAFLSEPYEYFLNSSSGEILRILNKDVDQTYSMLMTLLQVATESIVSLALLISIFIIAPVMTTVIVTLLGVVLIIISKIIKPILQKKGSELRFNSSQSYKWILQSIQGIKEIKISHKEEYFEKSYDDFGRKTVNAEKWENVFNNTPRLLIEMGCVCATLAGIAVMIYCDTPFDQLIPALGAFAMAAVKLMPSANKIVKAVNSITFQGPAIDNLLDVLRFLDEGATPQLDDYGSLSVKDKIEMKDIVYKYPNTETLVLDEATMVIPAGKSVGIVGSSGSGKTTTVDVLLGLLNPEKGLIMTDGVNVRNDYVNWLGHIGYIPQNIFMLDDSIKANVAFGSNPDENKVHYALREAQLEEFVKGLPDGIETKIGERGVRLSGGQKQRIGIARALYANPEVLVFDEATSSLDNETESAIMESISSLHGKKTMIIIAHRLHTIEGCDIVYRIKNRKIVRER